MISQEMINDAVDLLASSNVVRKVILFGSYARGDATEDSDVDFLVVEKDISSKVGEMMRFRRLLRPLRLPIDIMVVSEGDLDEWGHLPGTALYWALREGRVLKDVAA